MKILDDQLNKLMDRLIDCDDKIVAKTIESRIKKLELQRLSKREAVKKLKQVDTTLEHSIGTVLEFIAKPYLLWDMGM